MYYNLPGNVETLESAYNKNEMYEGGHFPIGNNNCWHSGIHIFSDKAIKPLAGGQLIAYRINEGYQSVPLLERVSGETYLQYKGYTQRLYHNPNEESDDKERIPVKDRLYHLIKELLTEMEYNELDEEMKDLYQKDGSGKYIPVMKFTTNFVILKHTTTVLPQRESENTNDKEKIETGKRNAEKRIEFYTLYMGLKPGISDNLKRYYNVFADFSKENIPLEGKLPFYQTWKFRLKSAGVKPYFITGRGNKIFENSICNIDEKASDNNGYHCIFYNAQNETIIVPKDYMEILEAKKYKPNEDRVSVYKYPTKPGNMNNLAELGTQQIQIFKIAELRRVATDGTDTFFQNSYEEYPDDKNYCKVEIYQKEIYPDITRKENYTWWLKGAAVTGSSPIRIEQTMQVYYKENNPDSFKRYYKFSTITGYLRQSFPVSGMVKINPFSIDYDSSIVDIQLTEDKKIVSSMKINSGGGRGSTGNGGKKTIWFVFPPLIILENTVKMPHDILLFYYKNEKIESCKVVRFDIYAEAAKLTTRDARDEVSVICLSKVSPYRIKEGEFVNIVEQSDVTEDAGLPANIQQDEGLIPCRFACRSDNIDSKYRVLIRKDDLTLTPSRGRLKQIDDSWRIPDLSRGTNKGIIVYDGSSKETNARNIISEGSEFELYDYFLYKKEVDAFYSVIWDNPGKYAGIDRDAVLEAGVFQRAAYKGSENKIKYETRAIKRDDILGYPDEHPKLRYELFYDLVCFFNDASFINDTGYYAPAKSGNNNEDPQSAEETNLLDWKKYFFVEGTDNDGDLFCDCPDKIIEAIKNNDDTVKKTIEGNALFTGGITCDKYLEIYSQYRSYPQSYKPIIEVLRKIVCSHPLEWDKSLYKHDDFSLNMNEERFKQLEKEIEALDIWKAGGSEGIKEAAGNPASNNFWFAHPVYFINHLERAGLLKEEYIKVSDNIQGYTDVISFYNTIADIARGQFVEDHEGYKCNRFIYHVLENYFHDDVFKKVFPNGTLILANEFYDRFKANEEIFENINSQGIETIQEMADNGDMILVSYKDEPSGHIAFVGHRALTISTITRDKSKNADAAVASSMGDHDYWPVVVQAGVHTGVTSIVYATNDWRDNKDTYLIDSTVCFYKIRR
jgi:hypothetical protein